MALQDNRIQLDEALRDEFAALKQAETTAIFQLARKAYSVREQYLNDGKYSGDFKLYWNNFEFDTIFGSMSSFTKYALAGTVLEKVIGRYELKNCYEQLPQTVSALYELRYHSVEQLEMCFQDTYTRTEKTNDRDRWSKRSKKKAYPLIHPHATAASLRNWHRKWENPQAEKADNRQLPFIEIKASYSVLDFDKSGNPNGNLKIEELKDLLSQVETLLDGNVKFKLESNLDRIQKSYDRSRHDRIERAQSKATGELAKAKKTPDFGGMT